MVAFLILSWVVLVVLSYQGAQWVLKKAGEM